MKQFIIIASDYNEDPITCKAKNLAAMKMKCTKFFTKNCSVKIYTDKNEDVVAEKVDGKWL